MTQKAPLGIVRNRLDDMLSILFGAHIINYEPLRGFMVLKFTMYDKSGDPFGHLMHYR